MGSLVIVIDWDKTLVDEDQEWLPGALDALRWFRREKHKVIIHSARANYDAGRSMIETKLWKHNLSFIIKPKPDGDIYIDDKGFRLERWPDAIKEVRRLKRA